MKIGLKNGGGARLVESKRRGDMTREILTSKLWTELGLAVRCTAVARRCGDLVQIE
jgi:hypothetical protein